MRLRTFAPAAMVAGLLALTLPLLQLLREARGPLPSSWGYVPVELAVPGRCLADAGGCPPPVVLPGCASGLETLSVTQAMARPAGARVAVHGQAVQGRGSSSTLVYCEKSCCNRVSRELELAGLDASDPRLRLGGRTRQAPWQCTGDESAQCCALPLAPTPIVVHGRLSADEDGLLLEADDACSP